ncbi:MAG: polyprenyl diphosphate synthase [Candidatus Moraniibacteriota bacterium]|jgi:undecaprenyl diphosphate synthase
MENNRMPLHVAVIPDGNRRWAKDNGVDPWIGHEEGAKAIEEIARKSRELGIKYLSFWGSSVENMTKRPLRERKALLDIYDRYFTKLLSSDDIFNDEIKINVFGDWRNQLPKKLVTVLEDGIEKTKNHSKYVLNFFLAYSGDEEMLNAIRKIVVDFDNNSENISKETIKNYLLTRELPPVDYLIRTGGEPHLSAGFMMWDIANAQLFFSQKNFPDFDNMEFEYAIDEYLRRTRRLGA